jgi:hypothetical protein
MRFKTFVSFSTWMMLLTATVALAAGKAVPVVVEPAAQAAAARDLKVLGGQNLTGMPRYDQMEKAALGEPLAVKMVRLDELQRYQAASVSDPTTLLHDTLTVVYPIGVAGKVHGEMVVSKVEGVWSARSFAGPEHIQAVENIRRLVMNAAEAPAAATMLVRVPALNIEFIAYRDEVGLQLTPITDIPTAGLTAGQTVPASRVFELLSPLARQDNGLPR